jgi:hypothetical protein
LWIEAVGPVVEAGRSFGGALKIEDRGRFTLHVAVVREALSTRQLA